MNASTTPEPSGEYARKCEKFVDPADLARAGDPIAIDLLACERALEAARAERDEWAGTAGRALGDLTLCEQERDRLQRELEAARAERDALKAEVARLSGEVDQSLIAQAFTERDAARAALREISDGGWCDSCRASTVASDALLALEAKGGGA